ncbi:2-oxoacid:acceptor oxidoreductase family protein [Embleya sp. NBC_00896]|uniref:2-oxoacid:acceptor oxidoreductase family protein n=1 Tax=Embleya sp. NBC_00896 TaxID=2975961 RepID=UPI002F911F49|nr:2-oxoacid:acceptor oxidoreductase family protein [Embleya sp. NBC_00896]
MQREVLLTGIGGQGIQLATALLAAAAVAEGRHAMYFGSYGGMMRGGNSDTTLVLGDAPVESPPTIGAAWSALVLHPAHAAGVYSRLYDDGLLVINTSLCDPAAGPTVGRLVPVPASELAASAGNPAAVTMIALGAYAAATAIVTLDALLEVAPDVLPPYRRQHAEGIRTALRTGHAHAGPALSAWPVRT